MPDSSLSFWTFSLQTYAKPSVAQTCLDLQDRFGIDVNVILFMLWCAHYGRRLSAESIRNVVDLVNSWQADVVYPLRLARRALKHPAPNWPPQGTESLRERVKAAELEAERLQQEVMASSISVTGIGLPDEIRAAARANLESYAEIASVAFPEPHIAVFVNCLTDAP
ncbi:MAG: TIGR02444 family protein [Beijerinckiaceae bacterium]